MAATGIPTPNIGLRIPQGTDPASVDDINYNSNLLDTKLGAVGNTSVQDQIDSLNSNMTYKTGDTFSTRSWRAVGRIINSGKGLFCWIDMAKPVNATSFSITFSGTPNLFGIETYTVAGTISNKAISGNELQFVIDLSSTHTVGQIGIAEFNASITLT